MTQYRRTTLLPALILALLAAGCGGSSQDSTPTAVDTGSTPAPAPSTAASPAALATEPITGFEQSGELLVEVDGQPAPEAAVYEKQSPPTFLITAPALPAPVLVRTRNGAVETLDPAKVVPGQDGTLEVQAGAGQKAQGTFTAAGEEVRFTVDGKAVVLKSRPPLLGTQKAADLKAYSPIYERGARAYRPDGAVIADLKRLEEPALVQIYFGSWCPHCKQEVPKVVRVEEELAGSQVRFEYYGLPPQFLNEPEAKRLKINAVPTGIVYRAGREVGRLQDWRVAPELGLRDVLAGRSGG